MEKYLSNLRVGEVCCVLGIHNSDARGKIRCAHLGIVYGQMVTVLRIAPKAKAMLIEVRGSVLALEQELCKQIVVQVV